MSPESPSELKFDIDHVLFIDIVGYSKLLIAERTDQTQTLREIDRFVFSPVRYNAQFATYLPLKSRKVAKGDS